MSENLRDEQLRSTNSPIQLDDLLQSEVELPHFRMVMKESFQIWKRNLTLPSLFEKGALFVCDPQGLFVDGLLFDSNLAQHCEAYGLAESESWDISIRGCTALGRCLKTGGRMSVQPNEHEQDSLKGYYSYAVPILNQSSEVIGVIGCITPNDHQEIFSFLEQMAAAYYAIVLLHFERMANRNLSTYHLKMQNESKKRDTLFEIAKKLHAKIDVDSVLSEVMDNLKEIYPNVEIDLYLSQDNHSLTLPVKPLHFQHTDHDHDICTRAFMEGQLIIENGTAAQQHDLAVAAPLSGKQGVYGVLHFKTHDRSILDDTDIKFISMIADSAGNAFENAKLYEQSNVLINELRLINEITSRLNQSLKLNEIFHFASNELTHIFKANYGCILQLDNERNQMVVQASNLPEMANDIFKADYGFAGMVVATKEPMIISDYWANQQISSKLMEITKSRSLIAAPIRVNLEVMGVILMVHQQPNYFSYDNYKLLQVLSGHIGLAMANASLHAEVRRMVITDNLTNLYARHYLDEQVNFMQKKDFCGSLIVADIDHFKKVNDTHGHQVGDKILIQVAQIIQSSIRDTDIAARWGGEELAIYLPQATLEQTVRVAERIRIRVASETDPSVSVSCGVAEWNWEDDKISVESLFYKADMALYEAKKDGRNRIKIAQ